MTVIPFATHSEAIFTALCLSCWLHLLAPTIPTVCSTSLNCPLQYKITGASLGSFARAGYLSSCQHNISILFFSQFSRIFSASFKERNSMIFFFCFMRYDSCLDRIQMNITACLKKICIISHQTGLIPSFKNMSPIRILMIKIHRITL